MLVRCVGVSVYVLAAGLLVVSGVLVHCVVFMRLFVYRGCCGLLVYWCGVVLASVVYRASWLVVFGWMVCWAVG